MWGCVVQIYASWKYPRIDIHQLRPGKLVQQATDFTPIMLSSPDTGEARRVGPFHMKPATAIRSVTSPVPSRTAQTSGTNAPRSLLESVCRTQAAIWCNAVHTCNILLVTMRDAEHASEKYNGCRFASEVINAEEESAASDMLRSQYQADRVAGLQISISPSSFHASPIYVPASVFRSYHFGAKMHTFVSGDTPHLHISFL